MGEKKNTYKPLYLNEEQIQGKGLEIIALLEGIPMGHALHILDETKLLLLDSQIVDLENDQFSMRVSEHQESLTSPGGPAVKHRQ